MTTKSPYEQRAIKFITSILAPIYATAKATGGFEKALRKYNKTSKRPLTYTHGYTRVTVIRNDYVVKVTYNYSESIGDNKAEAEGYEIAKEAGFEYLFAKPTLFEYEGLLYEIMPKIRGIGNFHRNFRDYLTDEELEFVCGTFADLHVRNVGYYKDRPIFIDYSCHPY